MLILELRICHDMVGELLAISAIGGVGRKSAPSGSLENMMSRFAPWLSGVRITGKTRLHGFDLDAHGDGGDGKLDLVTLRYPGRRTLYACNTTRYYKVLETRSSECCLLHVVCCDKKPPEFQLMCLSPKCTHRKRQGTPLHDMVDGDSYDL